MLTIIFNKATIVFSVLLSKRIGRSGQSAIVDCPEFFLADGLATSQKNIAKGLVVLDPPFASLANLELPEAVNLNPQDLRKTTYFCDCERQQSNLKSIKIVSHA